MTPKICVFILTILLVYSKQSYWNYNKHAIHIRHDKGNIDYAIINAFHGKSASI